MAQAIGQTLAFGAAVALSPLPVILVVVMLGSVRGPAPAAAFLLGWMLGLAVLGAAVLLLAGAEGASEAQAPADWVSALKGALGAALLVLAARQWRARDAEGGDPELPAWVAKVDAFGPARAAGTAVLFAAVKPKNLILTIGACAAIAETGASTASQAAALAVFVLIASAGLLVPFAIHVLAGDRAAKILADLREWMTRENGTIIAVICLLIGAKLIGDAIGALAG